MNELGASPHLQTSCFQARGHTCATVCTSPQVELLISSRGYKKTQKTVAKKGSNVRVLNYKYLQLIMTLQVLPGSTKSTFTTKPWAVNSFVLRFMSPFIQPFIQKLFLRSYEVASSLQAASDLRVPAFTE